MQRLASSLSNHDMQIWGTFHTFLNERKEMPLTVTFFPQWTRAARFRGRGREDAAVRTHQREPQALAVHSMQLAHRQGQHPSPPLVPSTHLQGRPGTNVFNYVIYKTFIP